MKHQFLLNLFFVLVGIASSQQPGKMPELRCSTKF